MLSPSGRRKSSTELRAAVVTGAALSSAEVDGHCRKCLSNGGEDNLLKGDEVRNHPKMCCRVDFVATVVPKAPTPTLAWISSGATAATATGFDLGAL